MTEGYEEDLNMYEESLGRPNKQLDREALLRPIREMEYRRPPIAYEPGRPLSEVLLGMVERGVGAVLILEAGRVAGIFCERDLLIKRLYEGKNLDRPIREFMTPDPDCLTPDDPIGFALNRMVEGGYRHIPIISPDKTPIGLVAMRHVMSYVQSFFPVVALNLPPHSEHNPPDRSANGG